MGTNNNAFIRGPLIDKGGHIYDIRAPGWEARTDRPDNGPRITEALTAASRAGGGTLYIPVGTWLVAGGAGTTRALAGVSNVSIVGDGPSSVLRLADNAVASGQTTVDLLAIGTGVFGAVSGITIDNLTFDLNGTNQAVTSRGILLNGCTGVTIGSGVRIINARTRSVVGANNPRDITVGGIRNHIDALVMGCRADGHLFTSVSVVAGSNQVTVTGATATMNGLPFEVEQAGAPDTLRSPAVGWQNLVGYAKYVSATELDMYADSTLLTPLLASNAVSGARAVVATDDTSRLADCLALSQACGGLVTDLPASVLYTGAQTLHSGDAVEGHGAGVSYVKAKRGTTPFVAADAGNLQIRGLTIDGYGPDGGSDGASFQTCITLSNCTNVLIEDVTCRNAQSGITINDQLSSDTTLRRIRCENMFTANGAYGTDTTGGLGVWIFNGPDYVKLEGLTTVGTDRHGVYFDPGTTSQTASNQHDFIDHAVGTNIQIYNAARSGIGVGFGLQGTRWGSFSNIVIDTVGFVADDSTWHDCDALSLIGDQNGEYPDSTTVIGVTIKDAGGKAVWLEGRHCHVQGVVDGFNRSGSSTSVAPIYIDSYTRFNLSGVTVQGPDPSYNTVELEAYYRDADVTKYTHAAVIKGGTSVPDGNGGIGTRTAQALGNTIRGRFVRQGRKYTDGVTNATTTLTSASAIFSPDDVGKTIRVVGAGTAGADLYTTIVSRNSATSIVLLVAAIDSAPGHTFYVGNSAPSTGMLSTLGGAIDCPIEGPNANVCVLYGVADQGGSQIDHSAVRGEAFSRWHRTAAGLMEWGSGSATYDSSFGRIATGVVGVATGALQARERYLNYAADGAIAITPGLVGLGKASAAAMTLATPASPGDDGTHMRIISRTAFAHVVTLDSGSFDNAGAAKDVATFGGAIGDTLEIEAVSGIWMVTNFKNVTFS